MDAGVAWASEVERAGATAATTSVCSAEWEAREREMIDRESLRKMCEYEIKVSLVGAIEPVKETARERADRIWGMTEEKRKLKEVEVKC